MKKIIFIPVAFLITIGLVSCDPLFFKTKKCKEDYSGLISDLLFFSNPIFMPDDFSDLMDIINSNSNDLNEGSSIYDCMEKAGNNLQEMGYELFESGDADHAYGRALELGATIDQANTIRNDINNEALDLIGMGKELIWLKDALPEIVKGDTGLLTTGGSSTRQQVILSLQLLQQTMSNEQIMMALEVSNQVYYETGKYVYLIYLEYAFEY